MSTRTKKQIPVTLDTDALYMLKRVCRAWYDLAGADGHYTKGNEEICLGAVANLAQHMKRAGLKF